jgi:predicted DNA-binding protein (MmcQ/YjbR family)
VNLARSKGLPSIAAGASVVSNASPQARTWEHAQYICTPRDAGNCQRALAQDFPPGYSLKAGRAYNPGMNVDWLREVCLAFPGATEQIQWGSDLLFKVGGKMFAVTPLEPAPVCLSFKASPETFAELTERPNIIPAPYLARAQWVALETRDALPAQELARLLRESYEMVFAKLPRKTREAISGAKPTARQSRSKKRAKKKRGRSR